MTAPDAAPPTPPPPAPTTKRWKKLLLVVGGVFAGLLLILLIAGPLVIGSVAKSKIESLLGEQLHATVTVGDVSVGWTGHVVLDDLRIVPKSFKDPLLEVKKVDLRADVLAAIGGRYVATVDVVAPKVLIEKGPDGKFNYEVPPRPAARSEEPKAPKDAKKPDVRAMLTVRGGEVRIRGRGAETVYENLSVDAKVDALEKPLGFALSLQSPQKDSIKVDGAVNLETLTGPATLTLDRVSLKNLTGAARAYSEILELDGTVSGSFKYELKGAPRFIGKGGLEIDGFSATMQGQTFRLDKLTISHDGGIDDKGSGRHVLTLACGKAIGATVTADVVDAFGARLVKTDIKADTDLAALADVLAKVGALPKGMTLAGAISVRGTCDSKGPTQADLDAKNLRVAAKVDLSVTGSALHLVLDGKPMRLDGFTLHHAGTLDESGNGRNTLTLAMGKAVGGVVKVDVVDVLGKTPLVKADLQVDSDLGELGKLLEKLIGLKPDMALEGAAALRGTMEAKGAESVKADVALSATNLVAVDAKDRKRHEIDRSIVLKVVGGWDGTTKTGSADVLTLDSSFATMNGKGGVSLAEPVTVKESSLQLKADLGKLGSKLGLFMADPPELAGSLTVNSSYAGDSYALDATAKGIQVVNKGKTIGPIEATVEQKGTFSMAKDGAFRIATGVVRTGGVDLTLVGEIRKAREDSRDGELKLDAVARPVELSKWMPGLGLGGPEIQLTTTVSIKPQGVTVAGQTRLDGLTMKSGDVTKTAKTGPIDFTVARKSSDILATLKTASFEWLDKGYAAKGGLESQVTVGDKGTTGTTKLVTLELTDDRGNVVRDPGLTIVHDIGFADDATTLDLRKVDVASSFLRGAVTGRLLHVDRAPEFQKLRASFRYIPDKLTAFARPWLPGILEGAEEKTVDVTLDGKAASADALAVLRGTQGSIDIDVATFVFDDYGLTVAGKSHVDLKDGKLTSGTPLVLNKGKTELAASLDFNPAERKPQSTMAFSAKGVDANGRMGPILERINPIFRTSGVDAKVDGVIQSDVQLTWTGVIDPGERNWPAAASKSLSGGGVFGVQDLNIAGSPALGQIMAALGQGNALQGELVATQIRLGNGRCEYENMTLRGSRKTPETLARDREALGQEKQSLEAEKAQLTPREFQKRADELRMKEEDLPYRYVLRFSGHVRFDKQMELRVLMPMTAGMAKAHPNLQKYIGSSFWVDLKGTTESPSLDTRKMIAELVQRAAEGIVKEKLDDALKGLFARQREKDADKLFDRAQKADAAGNAGPALQQYQALLKDYADTDVVRKRRAAIEDRIRALGGK